MIRIEHNKEEVHVEDDVSEPFSANNIEKVNVVNKRDQITIISNEDEVREALHVPEKLRPLAMIPVGYPKGTPLRRIKRHMNQIIYHEE